MGGPYFLLYASVLFDFVNNESVSSILLEKKFLLKNLRKNICLERKGLSA